MSIYPLPEPEASYLRRFFDGIDRALSAEMQAGTSLREENLTFLLCRLLDGSSTFQRMPTQQQGATDMQSPSTLKIAVLAAAMMPWLIWTAPVAAQVNDGCDVGGGKRHR